MAIWLAALTTRPSESVRSRIANTPMTDTTSKPSAAHASVCSTSKRNAATRSVSSACNDAVTWVSILKIASTPLVRVAK